MTTKQMNEEPLSSLISKVRNTHGYENLVEYLGKELGSILYKIVDESEKADKELAIVHQCLTELYNYDSNFEIIKSALKEIKAI